MSIHHSSPESNPALPAVAVVLTCHDAIATIGPAIDSVLAQTFGNFELIIVDDGSVADCRNSIRRHARRDRRITLIEQAGAGPAAARNRGVRTGQAPLLAFIEAVDVWTSDHLASHVAALEAEPRVGVSLSRFVPMEAGDREPIEMSGGVWFCGREWSIGDVLSADCTFSSLVTRRDVVASTGPFEADASDMAVQAWLVHVIASGFVVEGLDRATVRRGEGSGGAEQSRRSKLSAWGAFLRYARTSDAPGAGRPNRRLARLMPRLPEAGLLPPSGYMAWIPARVTHRNERCGMLQPNGDPPGPNETIFSQSTREDIRR